jgi:RNA polymerase sigma-70 factor (ECF subfamily)
MQAAQVIDPVAEAAARERALVAAVLAGAPGAFEQLVRDHQGLCWHVIQRMVRHPEDTRELCQDTFLRVHRHLGQYRFDAPLKSWIAQVAYSCGDSDVRFQNCAQLSAAAEQVALDGAFGDPGDA